MLRNDLITWLSQQDNDSVVVDINGHHADVAGVVAENGVIVLRLEVASTETGDDVQPAG